MLDKIRHDFDFKLPINLKTKVYIKCILQKYGSKIWILTKTILNKIEVHQREIERKIIKRTPKEHKNKTLMRNKKMVQEIIRKTETEKRTDKAEFSTFQFLLCISLSINLIFYNDSLKYNGKKMHIWNWWSILRLSNNSQTIMILGRRRNPAKFRSSKLTDFKLQRETEIII